MDFLLCLEYRPAKTFSTATASRPSCCSVPSQKVVDADAGGGAASRSFDLFLGMRPLMIVKLLPQEML